MTHILRPCVCGILGTSWLHLMKEKYEYGTYFVDDSMLGVTSIMMSFTNIVLSQPDDR